LSRILAVRMTMAAIAVSFALLVFFAAQYLLFPEDLARKTLEAEATAIARAVARGENPALWRQYAAYPRAYAYRVMVKHQPPGQRVLSTANAELLPPLPPPAAPDDDPVLRLEERFGPLQQPHGGSPARGWMQTSRESVGGHGYWVELAMIGDPAWIERAALGDEMVTHVVVPVSFLIPALTLAILFTTRQALRPLTRLAEQARVIGAVAGRGATIPPLSAARLPREVADVVGALNAMLGQMDRALARQRQFAADAAHELRTPLAVLRLQLAALPPGPATWRMDEEFATLAHLISQLLRFAQAEDVMAREVRPVDVVASVRETCEDMAPLALARGMELEFVAPPNPVVLPSHPELLGVAVRNLVENALRASPPGGTVTIQVTADGAVSVADQGPGVPDAQKGAIFERLWRADRQRTDGAGIGLALVQRIARLHGGDVTVEDRPGGGARFVVHLRADTPAAALVKNPFARDHAAKMTKLVRSPSASCQDGRV
jgi:signal transduction histidine kinase